MSIEATLAERGERYGSFERHAHISQGLQDIMREQAGWGRMQADQRQALTVIADKIARMLNGDPAYRDNWHDLTGYAKLVDDRMARDEAAAATAEWPDDETHIDHLGRDGDGGEYYPAGMIE